MIFLGEKNNSFIRAHQVSQLGGLKMVEEHIYIFQQRKTYKEYISWRKKYHENRSDFLGQFSQNILRTRTIFQEITPQEQIFYKISSLDAFDTHA